jgi:hypothetical protein
LRRAGLLYIKKSILTLVLKPKKCVVNLHCQILRVNHLFGRSMAPFGKYKRVLRGHKTNIL